MKMRGAAVALFLVGCGGDPFVESLFVEGLDGGTGGVVSVDDAGTGGSVGSGGSGTGGKLGSGGSGGSKSSGGTGGAGTGGSATGGAATGGSVTATGGTSAGGTSAGGNPSSGGAPAVDACSPVSHDNGLGDSWEDCVAAGTHSKAQAVKACEAAGTTKCNDYPVVSGCDGVSVIVGYGAGVPSKFIGAWAYAGPVSGLVCSESTCVGGGCPSASNGLAWE